MSARNWTLGVGLAAVVWLSGCTLAPRQTDKPLVADDDPVFDSSFRDIDPNQLDLSGFWTDGLATSPGEAIPIHHRTFSDIARKVSASGFSHSLGHKRLLQPCSSKVRSLG